MYELNKKDSFTREVESLLLQIETRIDNFSQGISLEESKVSNGEASDMNTLKLHRYKMKEVLEAMKIIDDTTWRDKRTSFKEKFNAAEKAMELIPKN
jgi:hypothetical protein